MSHNVHQPAEQGPDRDDEAFELLREIAASMATVAAVCAAYAASDLGPEWRQRKDLHGQPIRSDT